jgi:hypothetical protein
MNERFWVSGRTNVTYDITDDFHVSNRTLRLDYTVNFLTDTFLSGKFSIICDRKKEITETVHKHFLRKGASAKISGTFWNFLKFSKFLKMFQPEISHQNVYRVN